MTTWCENVLHGVPAGRHGFNELTLIEELATVSGGPQSNSSWFASTATSKSSILLVYGPGAGCFKIPMRLHIQGSLHQAGWFKCTVGPRDSHHSPLHRAHTACSRGPVLRGAVLDLHASLPAFEKMHCLQRPRSCWNHSFIVFHP